MPEEISIKSKLLEWIIIICYLSLIATFTGIIVSNYTFFVNSIVEFFNGIHVSSHTFSIFVILLLSFLILILTLIATALFYKKALKPVVHKIKTRNYKSISEHIIVKDNSSTADNNNNNNKTESIAKSASNEPHEKESNSIRISNEIKNVKITSKQHIEEINEILINSERALEDKNIDDAKKYYDEAKKKYFSSNLDYNEKSKVYKKMIEVRVRINLMPAKEEKKI